MSRCCLEPGLPEDPAERRFSCSSRQRLSSSRRFSSLGPEAVPGWLLSCTSPMRPPPRRVAPAEACQGASPGRPAAKFPGCRGCCRAVTRGNRHRRAFRRDSDQPWDELLSVAAGPKGLTPFAGPTPTSHRSREKCGPHEFGAKGRSRRETPGRPVGLSRSASGKSRVRVHGSIS